MMREQIKEVAIEMVRESGLINLSRKDLCARVDIPDGSFPHIMECNFSEFVKELSNETIDSGFKPVVKRRVPAAMRKENILQVAVQLAAINGYDKITRDGVAEHAGVSMGLVTKYFGTMNQLRRDIMRAAIKREVPEIIAQGLVNGDARAKKAPDELKEKAKAILAEL